MLFHSPEDAVFGNPDGDITIVEFYDYNCGYCKRFFPGMQALVKKDPKIRFVMQEPLENNAEIAYRLGINYTPAYIVGSQIVPRTVRDNDLVAIIVEERKKGK